MEKDSGRIGNADQALVASDGAATHLHPTGFDPERIRALRDRLRPIAQGGDSACLSGSPMIPLHRDTVAEIYCLIDDFYISSLGKVPSAICGYPLPGWRLQRVEYDDGRQLQAAPGWIVSLHSECDPSMPRRYNCVMTRSLLGPLEAWDEAMQIALRENEAGAIAMKARKGRDGETRLDGEAATARASSEASPGKDNHA